MFGVPNAVVDQYLKLATPSQLKVLLYLLRHNNETVETQAICDATSLSAEQVEEALEFWAQTDLFTVPASTTAQPETTAAVEDDIGSTDTVPPCPTDVTLDGKTIAEAIQSSQELNHLQQEFQMQLGKPITNREMQVLIWLNQENHIPAGVILTVFSYCKSINKGSIAYLQTTLLEWWNDGYRTLEQINALIQKKLSQRTYMSKVRSILEMERKPTPTQTDFINRWQEQNVPLELIEYAYERTLDQKGNGGRLHIQYIDKIISSWMQAGYRTRKEAEQFDPPKRQTDTAKTAESQNKTEDDYYFMVENFDA